MSVPFQLNHSKIQWARKTMNPLAEGPAAMSMEKVKKNLFRNAMQGNWEGVKEICKQHPEADRAKITRSGDTAIHIAISDGKEEVVEYLVLQSRNPSEALRVQNELGNTPLHLAASLGNVKMCTCIANASPELIGIRNNDSETPLFLAVLHGRRDAFLWLHSFCKDGKGYEYSRRSDGETILHSAIAGEYFDLAFQIIHLYERLVDSVNERGFSPLHLLANKPSVFRSGSDLRGFHKLIYYCIIVDELEQKSHDHVLSEGLQYDESGANYPENYQTCVGFTLFLRNLFRVLLGYSNHRNNQQKDAENPPGQPADTKQAQIPTKFNAQGRQLFPPNYLTCFLGLKLISKSMLVILGLGSRGIVKLRERKEKHTWSVQIMEELLRPRTLMYEYEYEYEDNGRRPPHLTSDEDIGTIPYALDDGGNIAFSHVNFIEPMVLGDHDQPIPADNSSKASQTNEMEQSNIETGVKGKGDRIPEIDMRETPILIAAKNGVLEMVERILEFFPVAIHDVNADKKNVVLLAVENRQPHMYKYLLDLKIMKETIFRKTDKDGNTALHLAAMLSDHRPWLIPGAALQMQWEIKWYEFVKNSMPLHFFVRYNKKGETSREIFSNTHQKLVQEGGQWLNSTSESCSLVAALIATVAFATSATVPGGVKQDSGTPTLENESAFSIFAISSLIALCFSVTSVVMFLAILTSRYQEKDFGQDLPRKLLAGLSSLFVSIASMLVSFCAGHFFVLKDKLKYAAFPVYAVTCLPVTFFAIAQFPLYFDLARATFKKVPQRSQK